MKIDINILIEQMIMFFLMLICGFGGAKLKLLTEDMIRSLSKLLMTIICPMMLISAFASASKYGDVGTVAMTIIPITVVMYGFLMLFSYVLATILGLRRDKRRIFMGQCMFSNMGFFGLPLAKELFSSAGVVAFSFFMLVDNIVLWTEGVHLASGSEDNKRVSAKEVLQKFFNPVMMGMLIGIVFMICKVPADSLVVRTCSTIGDCAKPLALIYIGGVIAGIPLKSLKQVWPSAFIIVFKMMALPVLAYYLLMHLNINQIVVQALVLVLALPSMASFPVMADNFGSSEAEYASECVFVITLASLITIPFVMFLCQ